MDATNRSRSWGRPRRHGTRLPGDPRPGENPDGGHRQEIVRQLRARRGEMAAHMFDAIRLEIPNYSVMSDQDLMEEIRTGVARITAIVLDGLLERRSLSSEEIAALTEVGGRRAQQGFPLQSLIGAVVTGMSVGYQWIVACAAETTDASWDPTAVVAEIVRDLFILQREVLAAVTAGHRQRQTANDTHIAGLTELLESVLVGTFRSEEDILSQARSWGFELGIPQGLALVVSASGDSKLIGKAVQSFNQRIPTAIGVPMFQQVPAHTALLIPASPPEAWSGALRALEAAVSPHRDLWVVTMPGLRGPIELYQAYADAQSLLRLDGSGLGSRRVRSFGDLIIPSLLSQLPADLLGRFACYILGPLLVALPEKRRNKLLKTLNACHYQGSLKRAAQQLGLSVKTIRRHRAQIEELTGLSLYEPGDRLKLEMVLYLLDVHQVDKSAPKMSTFWTLTSDVSCIEDASLTLRGRTHLGSVDEIH